MLEENLWIMGKYLIMSDIHGNLAALQKIFRIDPVDTFDGIILLGDLIDYGPHSNEVIEEIIKIPADKLLVNVWGNHEQAIINNDYSRFSTERGKLCAMQSKKIMTHKTKTYLETEMENSGQKEFVLQGKKCLAVHGSLEDYFWKAISHEETGDEYARYDFVFSGHSHIPHFFEQFYDDDNTKYRNKKRTVFINPGSVGQPRNHDANAHYVVLELENMIVQMKTVPYDVDAELEAFRPDVDEFYKNRLKIGI